MRFIQYSVHSAALAFLLLLSQPVASIPQLVTSSNAVYTTDGNGNTIGTASLSQTVATAATTTATSQAVAAPVVATTAAPVVVTNPLGPAPVTTFTYTSWDASGNPAVFTAIFTPTYQPTVFPTSYVSATILAYSDFTSLYSVTQTGSADTGSSSAARRVAFDGCSGLFWSAGATIAAVLAGARMVAMM